MTFVRRPRAKGAFSPRFPRLTQPEGAGASAYASHPAPAGFYWDFVTYLGVRVTYLNAPVVALVKV